MDKKDILLLGWLKRSKNRLKVFLAIEGYILPSEIVRKVYGKWSASRYVIVSRALAELKEKGLVKIENPKERVGRVYSLAAEGTGLRVLLNKS